MSNQAPTQNIPSKTPTVDLLTSVIMRKKGVKPIFTHEIHGHTHTFTTPHIGNDNDGFRHLNAISKYDMGADIKKLSAKQPAAWVAVQRTVLAALVYAASATIPSSHPYHKAIQKEKGKIIPIEKELAELNRLNSRTPQQELQLKDLENKKLTNLRTVNDIWRTRFNKNDTRNNYQATIALAEELIESALNELDTQTALQPHSINAAKKAARDLLMLNQAQLVREAGYTLEEGQIYTEFNYGQSISNQFLMQRFGSTNYEDYLPKLLRENASGLSPTFSINTKALDDLIANTPIIADNIDIRSIPKSDYKGCVDEVKNGRVGMKLIAKKDGHTDTYNLLVVMHKFVGGQTEQYSTILNAKAIDAFDRDDGSYQQFLRSGNVTPYTNAERDRALSERIEKERLLQIENHARVVADNEQKLKEARRDYLTKKEVISADDLVGTYFDQKGLADLAVNYLKGMRIDQGKVWLPLSDVIAESKEVNSTNGYQQLLNEKVNLAPSDEEPHLTNKIFHGIGQGEKHRCFYTIGNPDTASLIIESEGIANGLIEYDMLTTRGYDVAVVCALDAGNINHATRCIIEQHPTKAILNIADNDRFDKHGNERKINRNLDNIDTDESLINRKAPKENVGLKVATNIHKAVGVPFGYIDFSEINGKDFTEQQRQNKFSDIDDLVSVLTAANAVSNSNKDQAKQAAYKEAGDYLEHITTEALKRDVNPHFSIETQHQTKWVGSTRNLSNPNLSNFHFLKKAITDSQRIFIESNDRRMEYSTYQLLLNRLESMEELDVEFNTQTRTRADSPQEQYQSTQIQSAHIAKDVDSVDAVELQIQPPVQQYIDIETVKDKLSSILIEISELDDAILEKQDKYEEHPTDINERVLGKLSAKMEELLAIRDTLQSEISALNIQTVTAKPEVIQKEPIIEKAPAAAEFTSWKIKYSALKEALNTYKSLVAELQIHNPQVDNLRLINALLLEAHIEPFDAPDKIWDKATQHPIDNQTLQNIFSVFDEHLSSIEKSYKGAQVTENDKNTILLIIEDATSDINRIAQNYSPQNEIKTPNHSDINIETQAPDQLSAEPEQPVHAQAPDQLSAEPEQPVEAQVPDQLSTEPDQPVEAQLPDQPPAEPEQPVEAQAPEQSPIEPDQPVETQLPEQSPIEPDQPVETQLPEQPPVKPEQPVHAQAPDQLSAEPEQPVETQLPEQPPVKPEQPVHAQAPDQLSAEPEQPVEAQAPEQSPIEPDQPVEAQLSEQPPVKPEQPVHAQAPDQLSAEPEQPVEAQLPEQSPIEPDQPVE
ncbi:hypothetical protein QTV44_002620, partial [Vibrio vulnificus]|nr:hypothetical protein [Vibrio vulnificus]